MDGASEDAWMKMRGRPESNTLLKAEQTRRVGTIWAEPQCMIPTQRTQEIQ